MAFTVEDGTGLTTANAYVSVADADTYFADQGNAQWAAVANSTLKEQAIVRATSFLDASYRPKFIGRRKTREQGLSWPRYGAVIDAEGNAYGMIWDLTGFSGGFLIPDTEIPILVKNATCELALRALTKVLAPDIPAGASAISLQKVGPLQIEYKGKAVPYTLWRYAAMLIAPLLTGSSANLTMLVT
jgi:hypothetical protein